MKLVLKLIIGVLLSQIIFIANPVSVSACNCYIPENAIEGLEKSDAVFSGKVKNIKKAKVNGETYNAVLIEVDKIWKGINESQSIVYTSWSSCQFEFEIGREYLLYSYKNGDNYYVMNCGRSTDILNGKEDLELLGPGNEPTEIVTLSFEYNKETWILGTIAVVVLLCTSMIIINRRLKERK